MADLVLDAQIDLEVNEADLQRSVDRAGDIIQDRGERATRPSGGGRGGVGVGGVAIGTLIGNMVAGITRTIGRLLRALVNLPRQLIQFAKSLREFSPSMNRAFTIFERRMAMFRRVLGERLAPQINDILDRIATFLENNLDNITSALQAMLSVMLAIGPLLVQITAGIAAMAARLARFQVRNTQAAVNAATMFLRSRGITEIQLPGMREPVSLNLIKDAIDSGLKENQTFKDILKALDSIAKISEEQKETTEADRMKAANERLMEQAAQANRLALDPITQFLGAPPSRLARDLNLRDRGIG